MSPGLAHSVQVRLIRHAHVHGLDPNFVLSRFASERFLYRLARSRHAERFVLKGGFLLLAWFGESFRPTRDTDLLGFGDLGAEALLATFREICREPVEPDGLSFDEASVRVAPIREDDLYGGQRVQLLARLGPARLSLQVDVGIGDAVVPAPISLEYPGLLAFPAPRLRAYRPETVVAEKAHALVELGARNSRLRDFFDLHLIASKTVFEAHELSEAIDATFARRGTPLPAEVPLGLTSAFCELEGKRAQWTAFARRIRRPVPTLEEVLPLVAMFLVPVLVPSGRARNGRGTWPPAGPWRGFEP